MSTSADPPPKKKRIRAPYAQRPKRSAAPIIPLPHSLTPLSPLSSTVIIPTGSTHPRRNIRAVMQLRTMLKKEMISNGTYISEDDLCTRVRVEWTQVQKRRREDLRRLSRVSFQFSCVENMENVVSAVVSGESGESVSDVCSGSGSGSSGTHTHTHTNGSGENIDNGNSTVNKSSGDSSSSITGDVNSSGVNSSGVNSSSGGVSSSGSSSLLDPLVPLIFNRHILKSNDNHYAKLWDRIAAYQLVKSFNASTSTSSSHPTNHSDTSAVGLHEESNVAMRSYGTCTESTNHSETQQKIEKLAHFANFANDAEWLAAVIECQEAPVAKTNNPLQHLHQPLDDYTEADPPRQGSLVSLDTLHEQIAAGNAGSTRNALPRLEMEEVQLRMTTIHNTKISKSKKSLQRKSDSQLSSQGETQSSQMFGQADTNSQRKSFQRNSSQEDGWNQSDDDEEVDPEAEQDAYQSDDDQLRSLLTVEELSDSDDDNDRIKGIKEQRNQDKSQTKDFAMKAATGHEFDKDVQYRHVVESVRQPGTFHVFVPLPTFQYVRTLKQKKTKRKSFRVEVDVVDDMEEGYCYIKKRNVEKLTETFSSRQDAVIAYDACVRRLYGYGGFSFTTKPATNEWHFTSDHISAKRSLRVFSHVQRQHQQQQAELELTRSLENDNIEGEKGKRTRRPGPRKVQVESAPNPSELDNAYRTFIENSLREMSEVQDLSSYSAWQRRGELLENTVPIEIPKKKKAKKRRTTQQVVKKQMPEPDEEAVV